MQNLTAPALAEWLADPARPDPILLDVREQWEVQTAHIAGITHIPLQQIPAPNRPPQNLSYHSRLFRFISKAANSTALIARSTRYYQVSHEAWNRLVNIFVYFLTCQ